MRSVKQVKLFVLSAFLVTGMVLTSCSGGGDGKDGNGNGDTTQMGQSQKPGQRPQMQGRGGPDTSSVTDKQLQKFTDFLTKRRQISQEKQPEIQKIVQEEGLTFRDYQKISRQQRGGGRMGQQGMSDSIPEAKMEKFKKAQQKIQPIRQAMQKEMRQALQEVGLNPTEYRKIARAINQSRSLQRKVGKMQQQKRQSMGDTTQGR